MAKGNCGAACSCCRKKGTVEDSSHYRNIQFNHYDSTKAKNNRISTCKYTWWNFPFKFLLEQYQRPNNIFFLIVFVSNCFPSLRVVTIGTLLTPIIFILVIGAIREIIEDVARAKADKLANSTQYRAIRQGEAFDTISANICQGDLLILRDGDEVPADCLLLYSHLVSKIAYVNTASLDGESNLKPRTAIFDQELTSLSERQCISLMQTIWGRVSVYPPNSNLSLFTGKASYTKGSSPALDHLLSPTSGSACTPARQSIAEVWRNTGIFGRQHSPEGTPTPAVASLKPESHRSEPDSVLAETSSTLVSDDVIYPDVGSLTPTSGVNAGIRECVSYDPYAVGTQTLFLATISSPTEKSKHMISTQDLRGDQGMVVTPNKKQRGRIVHFSTDNTLLRGMRLQNTPFAIGVVIYTGYETRLMMNQVQTHRKSSRVQQRLDRVLLLEILVMVVGLIICGGIAAGKNEYFVKHHSYAGFTPDGRFSVFLKRVMAFLILFSYSLPISLFVTLEISHLVQGIMIELDPKLRLPELVSCLKAGAENPLPPAKVQGLVKSSMLIEDLAEVDIIFSDKTGTLTRNEMVFHSYFTLPGGIRCIYDQITKTMSDSAEVTHAWLSLVSQEETTAVEDSISLAIFFALGLCNTIITFSNNGKVIYQGESPDEVAFAQAAAIFGLQLVERQADLVIYKYKVPLPKMEQFLPMGLELELRYCFPVVVPFTSTRKRMSIVVQEEGLDVPSVLLPLIEPYLSAGSPLPTPNPDLVAFKGFTYSRRTRKMYCTPLLLAETPGSPFLLSKGADTFLLPLCRTIGGLSPLDVPTVSAAIDRFSCEGLRTLAWATRQPTHEFLEEFLKTWPAISIRPEDDVEYQAHTALLEKDLSFLGATAIEDRLASLVPETLATLVGGGLKVWMLTGDKTQTAVNIARSSNLSPFEAQWLFLTMDNVYEKIGEIRSGKVVPAALPSFVSQKGDSEKLIALFTLLKEFETEISTRTVSGSKPTRRSSPTSANLQGSNQMGSPEVKETGLKKFASTIKNVFSFTDLYQKKQDYRTTIPFTTVIDSDVFKLIYQSGLHDFLLSITLHSTAVVCCRLSPEEKALIVTLTRKRDKQLTTLAIGDGANDCPMIKAAHIGVGIAGREGLHASNVSDFSIPEFRFLRRLLFVHGHYTHFRNSELIEYSIYKNIIITLLCGIYSGQSLFTAVMILNDKMLMMYNILLTFIPILVYSLCEKDIKDRVLELHPTVFRVFERKPEMNFRSIGLRIAVAIYQSIVLYLWSWYGMASTLTTRDGYSADFSVFGYYLLFELVCTVTVTFCINVFMWTWLTFAAIIFSILCFIVLVVLANYTLFFTDTLYGVPAFASRTLNFWIISVGAVATATLPILFYSLTVALYRPWSHHLLHYQYRHQLRDCCGRVLDTAGDITRAERYDECLAKVQTLMARGELAVETA
ncbi:putative Phospholipid-transporting ATPase IA [Giardia muris]|uniref:Putative Phospholipid-transporting ATPase IA n=1 Tax=Giardia muris TaxID=5742 RepID=A0A4Z1T7D0_GIAMU|nr:putative Phospholipid-transporting ATPase IA [Giardia muris]|eukprot:TNJ28469.1 putative Phospholipid-transporting ATPase IA [Giardia muris]